jgi:hypothetical protein
MRNQDTKHHKIGGRQTLIEIQAYVEIQRLSSGNLTIGVARSRSKWYGLPQQVRRHCATVILADGKIPRALDPQDLADLSDEPVRQSGGLVRDRARAADRLGR